MCVEIILVVLPYRNIRPSLFLFDFFNAEEEKGSWKWIKTRVANKKFAFLNFFIMNSDLIRYLLYRVYLCRYVCR